MTENQKAALQRLRRKIEILRLDMKAQNNPCYHDLAEMLKLVDMMEPKE